MTCFRSFLPRVGYLAALGAVCVAMFGLASPVFAVVTPIVQYDATTLGPAGLYPVGTVIVDQSGAGHDATVEKEAIGTSTDVPSIAPAGALSFDISGDGANPAAPDPLINPSGTFRTQDNSILNNADIVAAGGFTIDTWLKFDFNDIPMMNSDGSPRNNDASIIDYAGTEKLRFRSRPGSSTPGDSNIEFRISDFGPVVFSQQSLQDLGDNQWHHATASFQVVDGSDLTAVVGNMQLTIDDQTKQNLGQILTDKGDNLGRPIGFGFHPTFNSFDSGAEYDGFLYNPTISLGSVAVPEPASLAIALAGVALLGVRRWKS